MRSVLVQACVCTAIVMAGCTASPLDEHWQEARPLGRDLPAYRPPRTLIPEEARPAELASLPRPDEPLSLREALGLALMRNPTLAVFGWEVRAAEARALQAGLLPNPELEVEVENFAGSGAFAGMDAIETTVALSQLIELGGDRAARVEVARYGRDLAGWDYEAQRIEVLTETTRRYLTVLAAQRRLELAEQVLGLVERTFDTISQRAQAGEASPLERTRFQVQVATARIAQERAERELAAARQRLAASWGGAEAAFGALTGELATVAAPPSLVQLTALLEQNPALARYAAVIAQRRAQTELAKAEAVPDVAVGAGVRHFNESDDVALLVGASMPLPLFDRNQGTILETRFQAAQAQAQQEAAQVRLHTQLAGQYQDLVSAYGQAAALRDEVLPAARAAFEGVQAAFQQGEVGLLDVLDAQRTLTESESQYADALAAYHQGVAALEGLIGQPLAEVGPAAEANTSSEHSEMQQEQP